jgi:hypothetical protein
MREKVDNCVGISNSSSSSSTSSRGSGSSWHLQTCRCFLTDLCINMVRQTPFITEFQGPFDFRLGRFSLLVRSSI